MATGWADPSPNIASSAVLNRHALITSSAAWRPSSTVRLLRPATSTAWSRAARRTCTGWPLPWLSSTLAFESGGSMTTSRAAARRRRSDAGEDRDLRMADRRWQRRPSQCAPRRQRGRLYYDDLAGGADLMVMEGMTAPVACLDDVIASKRWADRPKDREVLPEPARAVSRTDSRRSQRCADRGRLWSTRYRRSLSSKPFDELLHHDLWQPERLPRQKGSDLLRTLRRFRAGTRRSRTRWGRTPPARARRRRREGSAR